MAIAKAIPDKDATTVANAIFKKLILEHGAPEVLLPDNGKEFTNDTSAYVCQEFNIEQHFTSPTHPGQMKRLRISTNFWRLPSGSYVKKTLQHGIKFLTRSYFNILHIGAAHIHLQVRHPIPYFIIEICHYRYKN